MTAQVRAFVGLALLLAALPVQAGWKLLQFTPNDGNVFADVSVFDERFACAAGAIKDDQGNSKGIIASTTDGGLTWRQGSLPGQLEIPLAVDLVDGKVGYLASMALENYIFLKAKVYRTGDSGHSWEPQSLPGDPAGVLTDIFFLDAEHGWTLGGELAFYTVDGGTTWQAATLPALGTDRVVNGVFFIDAQHGWAVGGNPGQAEDPQTGQQAIPASDGFVLQSTDGGASWQMLLEHTEQSLYRVWFTSAQSGWVCGGGTAGVILHTGDAGGSFTPQPVPQNGGMTLDYVGDLVFVDAQIGYAVASYQESTPTVLLTGNAGATWTVDASYAQDLAGLSGLEAFAKYSQLVAVSFPQKGLGMVAGKNALVVGLTSADFCPDRDGDGHKDRACNGDDCDDADPQVYPGAPELCNDADDDCDGVPDDNIDFNTDPKNCGECGFGCQPAMVCWGAKCVMNCPADRTRCGQTCADTASNPAHCGGCDQACVFPHAEAGCAGGSCQMGACVSGWVDLDGQAASGCEYSCTPGGAEACDGLDNDCDGQIDEDLAGCNVQPDGGNGQDGSPDGGTVTDNGQPDGNSGGCSHGGGGISFVGLVLMLLVPVGFRRRARG